MLNNTHNINSNNTNSVNTSNNNKINYTNPHTNNKKVRHGEDYTLRRNTIKQWEYLISEYMLIKNKKHPKYTFLEEFYKDNHLSRQNFNKYYNRYKYAKAHNLTVEEVNEALLPQTRGPKYLNKRTRFNDEIADKIKELRIEKGLNKYEIRKELEYYFNRVDSNSNNSSNSSNNINNNTIDKIIIPSYTTIYNLLKKYNINKLNTEMLGNSRKEIKRIIKENIGDLGCVDCHYLPRNIIENNFKDRYYLVGLIDHKSSILAITLTKDIKAITVMFRTLEMINFIKNRYKITFKEILTDNGSEFGSGKQSNNKDTHPFEVLLNELEIKHRYTKPAHPQTNGKIERVWRTINEELLDGMVFDSEEHLKEEIMKYNLYYNEYRPHATLNGKTPKEYLEDLSTN